MYRKIIFILFFYIIFFHLPAEAYVINFDDLPTLSPSANQGREIAQIPTHYASDILTWDKNFYYYSWDLYNQNFGNTYLFPSNPHAAFNGFGVHSVTLTASRLFNFTGAYFTGWAFQNNQAAYSSTHITIEGYRGDRLLKTISMNLAMDKFEWFRTEINGVDKLIFYNDDSEVDGLWWLMDNLTYGFDITPNHPTNPDNPDNPVVSEPSILFYLGIGILGILGVRRVFKK
jgi:hypothetical protein